MAAFQMIRKHIPTNIITGFLGSGKTTAILDLLTRKPAHEKWAVLVNEFGEIGIDGAILANRGAEIREVAGGCMCCAAGLPMQVALNALIAKAKPDRLLIEPTGLGHPRQIIDTLTGEHYRHVLELRAVIALIDARKLRQPRYREHPIYREQLTVADVWVANKTDLYDASDENYFREFAEQSDFCEPIIGATSHGKLDLNWLEVRHRSDHRSDIASGPRQQPAADMLQTLLSIELPPGEIAVRREHSNDGFHSCGWLFAESVQFEFQHLFAWASGMQVERLKAAVHTDRGNFLLNAQNGVLSINDAGGEVANILEIIDNATLDAARIERELLSMRRNSTEQQHSPEQQHLAEQQKPR